MGVRDPKSKEEVSNVGVSRIGTEGGKRDFGEKKGRDRGESRFWFATRVSPPLSSRRGEDGGCGETREE